MVFPIINRDDCISNDCISRDSSVKVLKFVDDTTVIGLILDSDESAYKQEVEQLACDAVRTI